MTGEGGGMVCSSQRDARSGSLQRMVRRCGQLLYAPVCNGLPNREIGYPWRWLWQCAAVAKCTVLEMAVTGRILHGFKFGWSIYIDGFKIPRSVRRRPVAPDGNGGTAKHRPAL